MSMYINVAVTYSTSSGDRCLPESVLAAPLNTSIRNRTEKTQVKNLAMMWSLFNVLKIPLVCATMQVYQFASSTLARLINNQHFLMKVLASFVSFTDRRSTSAMID